MRPAQVLELFFIRGMAPLLFSVDHLQLAI
jgi:hypothetical protein